MVNKSRFSQLATKQSTYNVDFKTFGVKINSFIYTYERFYWSDKSGGFMTYIRSYMPHRRRTDLEANAHNIQYLVMECTIRKSKWIESTMYKLPNIKNIHFISSAVPPGFFGMTLATYHKKDLVESLYRLFLKVKRSKLCHFCTLEHFLKKWSVTFSLFWHEPSQGWQ